MAPRLKGDDGAARPFEMGAVFNILPMDMPIKSDTTVNTARADTMLLDVEPMLNMRGSNNKKKQHEVVAWMDGYEGAPSYWLEWPLDIITTIAVQGYTSPFMVEYAHSHGVRVLQTDGCEGTPGTPWCSKLGNATLRAEQVLERGSKVNTSTLYAGFSFDFEHMLPAELPNVVLYVNELHAAFPNLFLMFYVGAVPGPPGWLPWDAKSLHAMSESLDLVVVSGYGAVSGDFWQTNKKGPWGCTSPCAVTSQQTVAASLSTVAGWASVVPVSKLALGVGW
jgi:hypothetical protein